jgi:hypothetical protein
LGLGFVSDESSIIIAGKGSAFATSLSGAPAMVRDFSLTLHHAHHSNYIMPKKEEDKNRKNHKNDKKTVLRGDTDDFVVK